ncbi:hypothetical protein [Aureimonas sp. ME7]|uniref:hypothetical protein n=1 Tax=Aureimonas sp. ME7 TaxID=2744252 RepID=UPI0015F667ED|nr:hypothetical protein [Aureimonas sp. ME7]
MFLDVHDRSLPEPWKPERPKPRLTKRQESALAWIVGLNLLMLLLGPIAGTTVIDAVWALWGG